jgi:hypothetical protein
MQTWVLVVTVFSALAGKPVPGGPAGITSIPGYVSIEACQAAGADLIQKEAAASMTRDAKRPLGERYFAQVQPYCIPGPVVK